jgi:hypothetical protein
MYPTVILVFNKSFWKIIMVWPAVNKLYNLLQDMYPVLLWYIYSNSDMFRNRW